MPEPTDHPRARRRIPSSNLASTRTAPSPTPAKTREEFTADGVRSVRIDDVETLSDYVREGLDEVRVAEFMALVADEASVLPPVQVVESEGGLLLADGRHRLAAHRRLGLEEIRVVLASPDPDIAPADWAYLLSVDAAAKAALPLSTTERMTAGVRLYELFHEKDPHTWNRAAIARRVGVTREGLSKHLTRLAGREPSVSPTSIATAPSVPGLPVRNLFVSKAPVASTGSVSTRGKRSRHRERGTGEKDRDLQPPEVSASLSIEEMAVNVIDALDRLDRACANTPSRAGLVLARQYAASYDDPVSVAERHSDALDRADVLVGISIASTPEVLATAFDKALRDPSSVPGARGYTSLYALESVVHSTLAAEPRPLSAVVRSVWLALEDQEVPPVDRGDPRLADCNPVWISIRARDYARDDLAVWVIADLVRRDLVRVEAETCSWIEARRP